MRMRDGARGNATLAWATAGALATSAQERGVPVLDVARGQLLQRHGAEVGQDLVLEQLVVALLGLGRDRVHGAPMRYPLAQVRPDAEPVGIDVAAVGDLCQQAIELGLRLAAAALDVLVASPAPTALPASVVLKLIRIAAALADVSSHDFLRGLVWGLASARAPMVSSVRATARSRRSSSSAGSAIQVMESTPGSNQAAPFTPRT